MSPRPGTHRARRARSHCRGCFVVAASFVIGIVVTSGLAADAQDQKPISGRVVDKNGAGVVGVTVWAVGGSEDAPETVAETVTDIQGNFTFDKLLPPIAMKLTSGLLPGRVGYDLVARAKDARHGSNPGLFR